MPASEKTANAAISRMKESNISEHNKELILEYDNKLIGAKDAKGENIGIGHARRKKIIDVLRWWALELKRDFEKAEKEDFQKIYDGKLKDMKLAIGTKNHYITILRQFYKHLEGDDEVYPDKVRKIKPLQFIAPTITEEGDEGIKIYTAEEIERLIQVARTPRDKCFVALSYDTGGRLDEIVSLKNKHVKPDGNHYRIFLHGNKTKKKSKVAARWVYVFFAIPYIKAYEKALASRNNPEAPFWISYDREKAGRALSYDGARFLFDMLKERAGIEGKRFHDLRHTKCTHLLRLGGSEIKTKKTMGWSANSKQLERYAHLTSQDLKEESSRLYKLPFERRKTDDIPTSVKCPICGEENTREEALCIKCNNPLTAKAAALVSSKDRYWKNKVDSLEKQMKLISLLMEKKKGGKHG